MALRQRSSTRLPARWEPLQDVDRVTDRTRRMLDETWDGVLTIRVPKSEKAARKKIETKT